MRILIINAYSDELPSYYYIVMPVISIFPTLNNVIPALENYFESTLSVIRATSPILLER